VNSVCEPRKPPIYLFLGFADYTDMWGVARRQSLYTHYREAVFDPDPVPWQLPRTPFVASDGHLSGNPTYRELAVSQ
jgi:hypothetical protein